jgi:hypothetical protein
MRLNRRWLLTEFPRGELRAENFRWSESEVLAPADG